MCRRRACMRRAGGVAAGRVLAAQPATRDCNHSGHQRLSKNKMLPRADTSHRLAPLHAAANTTAHTTVLQEARRCADGDVAAKRGAALSEGGAGCTHRARVCARSLCVCIAVGMRVRERVRVRAQTRVHTTNCSHRHRCPARLCARRRRSSMHGRDLRRLRKTPRSAPGCGGLRACTV